MEQHKGSGKREEIEVNGETRYVRRDADGHFTDDQVDKGRSLSADRRQHSGHDAGPGQGDRGDRQK